MAKETRRRVLSVPEMSKTRMLIGASLLLSTTFTCPLGRVTAQGAATSFAYVANFGSNNVSGFTINPDTGALTAVPGSPFAAGPTPTFVTVTPSGQFLYVANEGATPGTGSISAYVIDAATGTLVPVSGSPFPDGSFPVVTAVDPSGQFLYVAHCASAGCNIGGMGSVSAFTIDGATGALTPVAGSPFSGGREVRWVTVHPSGQFLYTANFSGRNVWGYAIDPTTGALTPLPGLPFPAGDGPISLAIDPSGQFAYVTNVLSSNISAYTIDSGSGALTAIDGSPFAAGGANPAGAVVNPTGQFAYWANQGSNTVAAASIDGTTGALTLIGSPVAAGERPVQAVSDPAGQFLYVSNCASICGAAGPGNVSAYSIDSTSGALTAIAGQPFMAGTNPFSVATTAPAGTTGTRR